MSLPIEDNKVALTFTNAGNVYRDGLKLNGNDAVASTGAHANYSNGFSMDSIGGLRIAGANSGAPAGSTYSNGYLLDGTGALLISTGDVATWANGVPRDVYGVVCADTGIPLPALDLDFTSGTLDSRITFTRASSATYVNSSGAITTATTNTPRFDYDPVTLEAKGLLIEEQRTNLLLNSDTLSTQNVTVTAGATTLSFYGTGTVAISGVGSGTLVGTGAYPSRVSLTFTPTAGTLTLTVTGSVRQAQLEAGSFATSYIPTTAAQATRAADVAVVTGTNFSSWYNQTEGTLYSKHVLGSDKSAAYVYALTQSVSGNELRYRYTTVGTTNDNVSLVSGVVQNLLATNTQLTSDSTYQNAFAFQLNDFARSADGGSPITAASGALPFVDKLAIGNGGFNNEFLNGHIKSIKYWNTRLSNTQLQTLTA